jgi:hypothetical protein
MNEFSPEEAIQVVKVQGSHFPRHQGGKAGLRRVHTRWQPRRQTSRRGKTKVFRQVKDGVAQN